MGHCPNIVDTPNIYVIYKNILRCSLTSTLPITNLSERMPSQTRLVLVICAQAKKTTIRLYFTVSGRVRTGTKEPDTAISRRRSRVPRNRCHFMMLRYLPTDEHLHQFQKPWTLLYWGNEDTFRGSQVYTTLH